jgi:hypothetical protein
MAIENLTDRVFVKNVHTIAFTVSNVNLTGRHVKWAMCAIDPNTGLFNPSSPVLQKTNQTPGHMTDVDLPNGQIDVNIDDSDTALLPAIDYHFQLEVFDSAGDDGVVVSTGTLTLVPNILETV